jgi:hypothetical protein
MPECMEGAKASGIISADGSARSKLARTKGQSHRKLGKSRRHRGRSKYLPQYSGAIGLA